ncbi:hypothetical protein RN001_011775 [Aquatica leii]|uniref:MADF domain-containing protein n=1 Tax=Aquatica leii TaxID=1421715 RepID=A0AAN7SM61_9COLE|nr:hypothetical protein RN001_011775 [Aquatica leii]
METVDQSTLIDLIEKFPHLWDKKHPKYKDSIAIENSWKTISPIMGRPIKECKEVWEYIRSKYVRERRLYKNIPSGSGAYTGTWVLFERLGFLDRVIQCRMSRGNVKSDSNIIFNDSQTWQDAIIIQDGSTTVEASTSVTPSEHSLTSEQETEEYFDIPITSPADSETSQKIQHLRLKRNATRHETRKRKSEDIDTLIATCTSIGKNMNNLLEEEKQNLNKGDYHFLMSMLESMSTLPDNIKLRLKANFLLQIANEIENQQN